MPRLPDLILDCVVYLYRSEDAAYEGEQAGGTGFLVGVKSQVSSDGMYAYLVTNKHVVAHRDLKKRAEVVRLNKRDGAAVALNFSGAWLLHETDELPSALLA
jgi:hypothetical protein